MDHGLELSTDFSGWMCTEDSLHFHLESMQSLTSDSSTHVYSFKKDAVNVIKRVRSCDIDPTAQQVMLFRQPMHQPMTLMSDVNCKLPAWALQVLNGIQEKHGINEYTHDCQLEFLLAHRKDLQPVFIFHRR